MAIVALISDFGTRDWFVAEMKGTILSIAPQATIVDITHEIPAGDLRTAAFVLHAAFRKFPSGTIFSQNVDPGTQSNSPVIIAQLAGHTFVAPDNGSISWIFKDKKPELIYSCTNRHFFNHEHSTFRGRDIIAPVAAHLANGIPLEQFGPVTDNYTSIPFPNAISSGDQITSEVLHIDRYGNIITSIDNHLIENLHKKTVSLTINYKEITLPVGHYYYEISQGAFLLYQGSVGYAEIAINSGSAAAYFNARIGDGVRVKSEE